MNGARRKTRVLVVDDSVVIRRLVSEVISADAELEVAGYAANGQIALSLLEQVSPDLITLDIEMPVMDGLATLKAMRARRCYIPVIMFSTLTERGAEATIDSLALGASDYVAKPTELGSYTAARDRIRDALIPKIKALCRVKNDRPPAKPTVASQPLPRRNRVAQRVEVVAIGCSTGGPNALAQLLPHLPADFPVPVLIVQHMPPEFTRLLAQRLTGLCGLPVKEAAGGEVLRPGTIWIAPGGFHLAVEGDNNGHRLEINHGPAENSCRPSVDVLFRSLVPAFADHVLAVVLTGMGQDGLRGCQEPYSIAMALRENFNLPGWKFSILATDFSSRALQSAQTGFYRQMEVNRGLPAKLLTRYFVQQGLHWQLKPEILDMVTCRFLNLAEPWGTAVPPSDVVFLRNVLIYFDVETRKQILGRVRQLLAPDGYLFLGCAETTLNLDSRFGRVQTGNYVCYKLKDR